MKNRTLWLLLSLALPFFLESKPFKQSYSVERYEDDADPTLLRCEIYLLVNNDRVGEVRYTISSKKEKVSYISYLLVYPHYRELGYGKVLFYHAVNDIRSHGVNVIELDRSPFNLNQGDSVEVRDQELKKWYQQFGFDDLGPRSHAMRLKNPDVVDNMALKYKFDKDKLRFYLA